MTAALFFLSAAVRALKRRQSALREQDKEPAEAGEVHLLRAFVIFIIYLVLIDLFSRPRYARRR